MTDLAAALIDQLDDQALDRLAELLAPRLAARQPAASGWLDTKGAAEHLSCSVDRVHDLVQLRTLTPCRDGRRLLFRREDLDAYVQGCGGAARTV